MSDNYTLAASPIEHGAVARAAEHATFAGRYGMGAVQVLFEHEGVAVIAHAAARHMVLALVAPRNVPAERHRFGSFDFEPVLICRCAERDLDVLQGVYLRIARRIGELRAGGWRLTHTRTLSMLADVHLRRGGLDGYLEFLHVVNPLDDRVAASLPAGRIRRMPPRRAVRALGRHLQMLEALSDEPQVIGLATSQAARQDRLGVRAELLAGHAAELRRRALICQRLRSDDQRPVSDVVAQVDAELAAAAGERRLAAG